MTCFLRMIIAFGLDNHKEVDYFKRAPTYPYWALQIILKGEARLTTSNETRLLPAGTLVMFAPPCSYTCEMPAGSSELWCIFTPRKPHRAIIQSWPERLPGIHIVEAEQWIKDMDVLPLLKEALAIFRAKGTQALLLTENLLERVILQLDRILQESTRPPLDERVTKAALFISTHFKEPLRLPALAAHVSTSPSRLSHLLRQQLGNSLQELLLKYRMDEAVHLLLSTNMRVNEVSTAVGYPDPFHFCARFTHYTGLSPKAFRQNPRPRIHE